MHKFNQLLAAALGLGLLTGQAAQAQETVGSTAAPGSTLQVAGSFAANYRKIAASGTTALTDTDFYTSYAASNTAAATFTLPAATSTPSLIGRVYYVKNDNATYSVTVTPNGSETINGAASVVVPTGQTVQLVSTGATSGSTWEVVAFGSSKPTVSSLGAALYLLATTNTSVPTAATITPISLSTVVYNSGDFTYNSSTGVITVNQAGTYIANLQISITGITAGEQLVGGITAVSTGNWIGRGSHYAAAAPAATTGGELLYVSSPVVLAAGQQVRFAAATSGANRTVLAQETGSTGTGTVTSALLQRVSNQ